jgi:hypothetical protein
MASGTTPPDDIHKVVMMRYNVLHILAAVASVVGAVAAETRTDEEFRQRLSTRRANVDADRSALAAEARITLANCSDAKPYMAYRFIEGVDLCLQPLSAAELIQLQDPFAVNVLQKGVGNSDLWPASVETVVSLVSAVAGFNQQNYMLGEGSQIGASVVSRDASRNLRYVITWGLGSSASVFLSAVPTGTHPGRAAPFLQVIGYDQRKNVFNYYQYVSNDDVTASGPGGTRTWVWSGDSTWSRQPPAAGHGCFDCHINGALNMKELVTPWDNWQSPRADISARNIPAAVAADPLYTALTGADALQTNFQGLQSRYTQGLVASSIRNGTITNVPMLLNRLINTTTVNFQSSFAKPIDTTGVQVPSDFFIFHSALTMPQINLPLPMATLTIPRSMHDAFIAQHKFALQQTAGDTSHFMYQQPGTNYFAFFVPVPAFEDQVAIRELINQHVIDDNFAAAILLVDFPNPVFSAQRSSLMQYAGRISSAQVLASGAPNPNGVPEQFIALVGAAANSQPPCDSSALARCTPEQQFLHFAGKSNWRQLAIEQINPYLAAIGQRIATADGTADFLTMAVARQSQFSSAPGIKRLAEFSLLFPCSDLAVRTCKRMNVTGTTGDDPLWPANCRAKLCLSAK